MGITMKSLACICFLSGYLGSYAFAQETGIRDTAKTIQYSLSPLPSEAEIRMKDYEAQKEKLSLLWAFVSLNMVGADVLSSYYPGTDSEIEEFAGGRENIKYFLLGGAVIYEVPFSMILLSRYLPYGANRWVNVGAAAFSTLVIIGGGSFHPHYLLMASVETLTLSWIAYTALKLPDPHAGNAGLDRKHDIGFKLDAQRDLYGMNYSYRF
jgi:hypothetical protein